MTAVADISFTPINGNHAESSSRAESSSSAGKRSSVASTSRQSDREQQRTSFSKDTSLSPSPSTRQTSSGGFLLDSPFTNGRLRLSQYDGRGKSKVQSNGSTVAARDQPQTTRPRSSVDSPMPASPLSRELAYDGVDETAASRKRDSRPPPTMDPAQLVQMALSLSEGRKRLSSAPLQVPLSPEAGKRILSGQELSHGTVKIKPAQPSGDVFTQPTATGMQHGESEAPPNGTTPEHDVLYTFTPATLSRAERARRYFELASEHRRLLELLPPLKPEASAHEERPTPASTNDPPDAEQFRTSFSGKHQLGRSYNPLQALRNRRLRSKERKELPAPPETFQETDLIRNWIDGVAEASKDPDFRPGEDQVRLPEISAELDNDTRPARPTRGHRRTDTTGSVIVRPDNAWTIEPAELLADTYWVEKGDNKSTIQDRHGHRIFPTRARSSVEPSRRSIESARDTDRRSLRDASDTEDLSRRRRHRIPLPHRLRAPHLTRGNRSVDTLSISSAEGRKNTSADHDNINTRDPNLGPLARHMQHMIEQDAKGETSSPEMSSPDHWDFKSSRLSGDRRRSIHQSQNGSNDLDRTRLSIDALTHRRSSSIDGRGSGPRRGSSPFDDHMSEGTNSSNTALHQLSGHLGSTQPPLRRSSPGPERLSKHHKLPGFRSRNKDSSGVVNDQTDLLATFGTPLSPVHSADLAEVDRQQQKNASSKRPPIGSRRNTGESASHSLRRLNTGTTDVSTTNSTKDYNKDGTSSMSRRLFKGGRIGEIVRYEGNRIGDRFRSSRDRLPDASETSKAPSEVSDTEDDASKPGVVPNGSSRAYDSDVSPHGSPVRGESNRKYYTSNLPSFTSPAGREQRGSTTSLEGLNRQQRGRQESQRSVGIDRLPPPKINLPDDDNVSNKDWASIQSTGGATHVPGKSRNRSKSTSRNDSETSPDARNHIHFRSDSIFPSVHNRPQNKRHWSISDKLAPDAQHRVTRRDIARVQTLLLASGIKAREILDRANLPRPTPGPLIVAAARLTSQPTPTSLARKAEPLVAANLLADHFTASLAAFEPALSTFQSTEARALANRLEQLTSRAADELTTRAADAADRADAATVELTTRSPLAVQRVDDAVDAVLRLRRRRFRVARLVAFKFLEWMLLAFMWGLWLGVMVWKLVRRVVVGSALTVRWLVWF